MENLTFAEITVLAKIRALQSVLESFTHEEWKALDSVVSKGLVAVAIKDKVVIGGRITPFGNAAVTQGEQPTPAAIERTGSSPGPFDWTAYSALQRVMSYVSNQDENYIYILQSHHIETRNIIEGLLQDLMLDYEEYGADEDQAFWRVPTIGKRNTQ